jgi:hypothetical protein
MHNCNGEEASYSVVNIVHFLWKVKGDPGNENDDKDGKSEKI